MDKKQCKALKFNKQRCIRFAHKGSEYCWQHRFSRLDDASWYNNVKIQALIAAAGTTIAILSFLFAVFLWKTGPTKANQEMALRDHEEILRKLADINERLPETIPPVLTKEDAERPLSVKEKELLDECEKWKHIAEQANIKAQFSLSAQLSHAGAMLRLAKYKEAESAYRTILVGNPDNTSAMAGLGITLLELAKYQEAKEIFKRALTIDQAFDPNSTKVAAHLNNLAAPYQAQGKYAEAEPLYQRALEIREKALGKGHPDVAQSLNNLASLYQAQGKYAEAEPLYQRALAIIEKAMGKEHPYVAISLNSLAVLYRAQGRYAKAEPLFKRAVEIAEKSLGSDHPKTITFRENWDICRSKMQGE